MTNLSKNTIEELRECYDTHAIKFSSTRKKNRPELDYIISAVEKLSEHLQRPLSVVELWCGDGRLYREIQKRIPESIKSYKGVDISDQLLKIAQENKYDTSSTEWIHDDMISYLSQQPKESIDVVISLASYQHLPDKETREQFGRHLYRTLVYEGERISIDRSWSQWMIQKHYRPILHSLKKSIISLWKRERNNLLIPFQDKGKTHQRLYHIHTLREIKKMIKKHQLQLTQRSYSSQKGDFHHNILRARNICYIAKKTVYSIER